MPASETPPAAPERTLLLTTAVVTGALVPLWGWALPRFILLDALALGRASITGAAAGALTCAATVLMASLRLEERPAAALPPRVGADLALTGTMLGIAVWLVGAGAHIPYIESVSLLCLQTVTGWAVGVAAWMALRTALRDAPGAGASELPGIRGTFTIAAAVLGLFAAALLSIGTLARGAGALDRQLVAQLRAYGDLGAAALAATGGRTPDRALEALTRRTGMTAELLPHGAHPGVLAGERASDSDDHHVVLKDRRRLHVVRTPTVAGDLWLVHDANLQPAVRAPESAFDLLILALLVLGAPLAAWLVGGDVSRELAHVTAALRRLGREVAEGDAHEGVLVGVPVATHDEVGDLARELNDTIRYHRAAEGRLRAALDAASDADRARDRLVAAADHELRDPLNAITGFCHLLQLGALNEEQAEDVALIRSAGDQLLAHVDEILDLSRMDTEDARPLKLSACDLAAVARDVLAGRADRAAAVTTELDVRPGARPAYADPHRIRQVVENLVSNALKFTREGQVTVIVEPFDHGGRQHGGRPAVRLRVADTGPGIPENELDAVFTEFYRVEGQRDVAGTGLGLAIARRLVDRHGGQLWVESELGRGSTFHLVLPVVDTEGAPSGPGDALGGQA